MSPLPPERAAVLAQLMDQAAADRRWSYQVAEAIASEGSKEAKDLAVAFGEGFYDNPEVRWQARLLPTENGLQTFRPADIDDETWEVWEAVAPLAIHPLAQATLFDMLFWGRRGNVGANARQAATAYIELVAIADSIGKVKATRRAFALIAQARLTDLFGQAVEAAVEAVEQALNGEDPKPGVPLRILEILVDRKVDDNRVDLLLERCRTTFRDPWNTSATIQLQRKRVSDEATRRELDRQEIRTWIEAAAASEPLAAMSHLQRAAELARDRGHSDLRGEAIRALQTVGKAGVPLKTITATVDVPREVVEAHLDELVGDDSWWDTLVRILTKGPPSGNIEGNRELVARQAREAPLATLASVVQLGPDNLPRFEPETDEEREDLHLARVEVMSIQWESGIASEALRRATEKYGPPSAEGIARLLKDGLSLDSATAQAIGRVVERFENGDYEAAAYTALPLIERLAREGLLALGTPLYRVQEDRKRGGYPGLGFLVEELSSYLDPSWYRYFRTLLTGPAGWNFRNEALHGFVTEVPREVAVAVIIALFYLAIALPGLTAPQPRLDDGAPQSSASPEEDGGSAE